MPYELTDPNATPNLKLSYGADTVVNGNLAKVDKAFRDLVTAFDTAFTPGSPIQLPPSGAIPGTYGDAADAVTITVDQGGRITSITAVAIQVTDANITSISYSKITGAPTIPTTLPPTGPAGGDLAGSSYPNPVVTGGAISRAKLAPNADCGVPVTTNLSSMTIPVGTNWTTIASVTITTRGGSVLLFVASSMTANVATGAAGNVAVRWLRDGTPIVTSEYNIQGVGINAAVPGIAWVDPAPAAGSHNYVWQGYTDANCTMLVNTALGGSIRAMEVG